MEIARSDALGEGIEIGRLKMAALRVRVMDCPLYYGRVVPFVFHHVNFPARRPAAVNGTVRHHPKGGPIALARWKFGPKFKSSVFLRKQSSAFHPGRSKSKTVGVFA